MHFDEQHRRALDLLIEKGIPAHRAEPAPLRLARKLGFRLRPVYFETFGRLTLFYGIGFAIIWGLFRCLTVLASDGTVTDVVVPPLIGAVLFGPAMAAYIRRQHGKLGLPSWEALAS
jgi:hypothetical protein